MNNSHLRAAATLLLLVLLAVALLVPQKGAKAAAYIVVTTTNDEAGSNAAKCSLREAIIAANQNAAYGGCPAGSASGADIIYVPANALNYVITILPDQTDSPTSGDFNITSSMQILGDGSTQSVIYATKKDRIFNIRSTSGPVTLAGLGIKGGYNVSDGGGILVDHSTVYLQRLKIYENVPSSAGGGVAITTGSVVVVDQTEISNNTASTAGAIASDGTLIITNSLIYNNTALISTGGINSNSLGEGEYTSITNTTIASNNSPVGTAAGILIGGTSSLTLLNDTIIDNAGIGLLAAANSRGSVKNTVLARQRNPDVSFNNCQIDPLSAFASSGHNLLSDDTCNFSEAGDQVVAVADLGLDPLADNGGLTWTYGLQATSPATDTGDDNGCPGSDQRLRSRPVEGNSGLGAHCDIGSIERNGILYYHFLSLIRK